MSTEFDIDFADEGLFDPPADDTGWFLTYCNYAGLVFIYEHDGDLWFTDSYVAVRLSGEGRELLAYVLGQYNLTLEPVVLDVDRTVMLNESRSLDGVGDKVAAAAAGAKVPAEPVELDGYQTFVRVGDRLAQVWRAGETEIMVDDALLGAANRLGFEVEQWAARERDPHAALIGTRADQVVVVAMPMTRAPGRKVRFLVMYRSTR